MGRKPSTGNGRRARGGGTEKVKWGGGYEPRDRYQQYQDATAEEEGEFDEEEGEYDMEPN